MRYYDAMGNEVTEYISNLEQEVIALREKTKRLEADKKKAEKVKPNA